MSSFRHWCEEGVKDLSTMNNIDEMLPMCHDCPYWEVCESPYICQIDIPVKSDHKSKQIEKTKGEVIEYAIKKKCQEYSLVDWCEEFGFTVDEFYKFLEFGRQGFNSDELRNRNCWE